MLDATTDQSSFVRACCEGLLNSIKINICYRVKVGDVLAEIESNESLKTYQIRAPISGRIVQRHANIGESTQDQTLFSIVNLRSEEHTSELQSRGHLVCRLLLEKKKKKQN